MYSSRRRLKFEKKLSSSPLSMLHPSPCFASLLVQDVLYIILEHCTVRDICAMRCVCTTLLRHSPSRCYVHVKYQHKMSGGGFPDPVHRGRVTVCLASATIVSLHDKDGHRLSPMSGCHNASLELQPCATNARFVTHTETHGPLGSVLCGVAFATVSGAPFTACPVHLV